MHAQVGKCNRLLGLVMLQSDNIEAAIAYQEKATLISERVLGRDHSDTIVNYVHLGQYFYVSRQVAKALVVLRHARSLASTTFGKFHPETPSIDIQIGLGLIDFKQYKAALGYLDEALLIQRAVQGAHSILEAHIQVGSGTSYLSYLSYLSHLF